MIRAATSACTDCLHRVKAWLAAEVVADSKRRSAVATEAKVHEKTLRLAADESWNPTIKTLLKLESVIPHDWTPSRNGSPRNSAKPRNGKRRA